MKPNRLKLSSLAEQRARPPITGIKESFTRGPVTSPKRASIEATLDFGPIREAYKG